MEKNPKRFKRLIYFIILLLLVNVGINIYDAFRSKGPSATQLINDAMKNINTAVHKIDSAKLQIRGVYEHLDSTKRTLVNLNNRVKEIQTDYAKKSAIIRREINHSTVKISELKTELKKEQASIDALRDQLKRLE